MGKKQQKKRKSQLNTSSFSKEDSQDSLCNSSSLNNSSLNGGSLPEKFLVSSTEAAGCNAYEKCLKDGWKDTVFLHPLVMREYRIEDLVIIKGEEKIILCNAYPVKTLQKTVIVFPKRHSPFKDNELVTLQRYEGEVKPSEEILVTFPEDSSNISEKLKQSLLRQLSSQYVYENLVLQWNFFDRDYQCTVKSVTPSSHISASDTKPTIPEFYTILYKTSLKMTECVNGIVSNPIGGLQKQIKLVKDHLQKFLDRSIYCGILMLEGPSGTGKSLLLETVLTEFNIFTEYVMWYSLCAMSQSEVKQTLKDVFQQAIDKAPSIIVFEGFNHMCPSKGNAENLHLYITKNLSHHLKTLSDAKVMVIATTNDADYDTSVLLQSERLMEVIKFQIPSTEERVDILKKLLVSFKHELDYEHIETCAGFAHGFTGKDLLEAIKDAQLNATKREFPEMFDSNEFLNVTRKAGKIKYSDLHSCIKLKKKYIVHTTDLKIKKVQWSDIGGMTVVKEKLKEVIEWPLKYPEAFKKFNVTPSRGVLMYGPPGCSKTMIARALATECELNFIPKKAADLFDKYVGESEKAIRDLFALAKAKSPCIIFLDEIDALVTGRESSCGSSGVGNRIVTTLLTEMDGIEELHGVIIIAATNRPDMLDDALIRNGRIDHFIYVSLPDTKTREEILKISLRNRIVSDDFDFKLLAEKTEGYSGAEIVNLCNEAAFQVLEENPKAESPVFKHHHFELALKYVLPRTNKEMLQFYEDYNRKHCT